MRYFFWVFIYICMSLLLLSFFPIPSFSYPSSPSYVGLWEQIINSWLFCMSIKIKQKWKTSVYLWISVCMKYTIPAMYACIVQRQGPSAAKVSDMSSILKWSRCWQEIRLEKSLHILNLGIAHPEAFCADVESSIFFSNHSG